MKKLALVAASALMLASPAFAQEHKYQDTAPHANMTGFQATGQSEARSDWTQVAQATGQTAPTGDAATAQPTDAERAAHRAKMEERMKNMTPEQKAEMQKRMEARHERMQNMTPAERAAAKEKWEARRKAWDAMTPEQKAAAKAKWDDHKSMDKDAGQTTTSGPAAK